MAFFTSASMAVEMIENRRSFRVDREALQAFLHAYDDPHLKLQTIHVAGTNGKGSTTNYISHILMEQGYTVGMFTSPYLITHFDRIRINDHDIPEEVFLSILEEIWEDVLAFDLNMFEIDFVLSALYFVRENVDFAVYEVGMGGRLDATNEVMPLACAITNIGMDHMQYLGDTYEKIAYEKAGIIKESVPCFTTETRSDCLCVMRDEASQKNTQVYEVSPLEKISYPPLRAMSHVGEIELGEVALYQLKNGALAIAVIESLRERGFVISDEAIQRGMQHSWKGRFERVSDRVYIDGAHNEEGVIALCESIQAMRATRPVHILFACLKDKPFVNMLSYLEKHCDSLTLTCIPYPRACKKEDYGEGYSVIEDPVVAIEEVMKREGLIFITGSLYFITLVKRHFEE
ncbi:MAG: bifunctional folylpolyglutamate synthase/dihydrofolate synthase [Erysipelotrichaceae bacterium]|nr:bifunctional folylpolyglutamate synthase/dihydrofolate synthase [Erysipelotrichaceae bacterium]